MITEDYVSFETAKLLKEKGFDEYCQSIYDVGSLRSVASLNCHWDEGYGELIEEKQNSDFGKYDNAISAPTLGVAMKWLREKYKIHICVVPIQASEWLKEYSGLWCIRLYFYNTDNNVGWYMTSYFNGNYFKTYEEACEAGIKYCLEKLI